MPDKALTMKWDVFRDKLRPGQEEEWRLTIKTPQGTPADAEMLATMYDASLDKLYPNRQNFNVNYPRFNPQIYWSYGYTGGAFYSCHFSMKEWKIPAFIYDTFYSEEGINEAMIIGYRSVKRTDVTGSVQVRGIASPQTKMMAMADNASADLTNMLAGKAAGLMFEEEMSQEIGQTADDVESGNTPRTTYKLR